MKIGADPELFLQDGSAKFISSIGLIGGSKEFPRPIPMEGCAVQEDNVAVEFNIPPCETVERFIRSIKFNMDFLTNEVKSRGLSLAVRASAKFEPEELMHPKAMVFGCDPDINAWTKEQNPRPFTRNKMLRSAGGHVHVGFDGEPLDPYEVVKAMDVFLGVPSLFLDSDTQRRLLYGKAGACRVKDYGVEYRTLSNFWLKSEDLMKWVYNHTLTAVNFVREGGHFTNDQGVAIQHCINDTNLDLAQAIKNEYGII